MGKKNCRGKKEKKRGRQLADDTWAGVINTPERVNHHPAPATGVGLYVARVIISALKRWMRRRGTYEEEEESLSGNAREHLYKYKKGTTTITKRVTFHRV
jgi:hypothetical protein